MAMASTRLGVITLSLLLTASGGAGRDFIVDGGGSNGWTTYPAAEPQDHFQINDTLVFRYDRAADSVLWVSRSHYDACNTTEPILRLDGGDSHFVLNISGSTYYFISADARRCRDGGERLIAIVRNSSAVALRAGVLACLLIGAALAVL